MAVPLYRSAAVTSSLASQSPTTSSVLEFRCMFTHDVHKKQKKWHDGELRFHVFNKRVMVYDETKNFVGDLHYRLSEDFGEGLELRLERPVLVQVEEQLGQSKTDLTPLFNRSKQDGDGDAAVPPPSRTNLSRINAANPQIKPKSIRELLGASQGRMGRARIPIQSPYEQRVALAEIQPTEPPPKRRKVLNEKLSVEVDPAVTVPTYPQQVRNQDVAVQVLPNTHDIVDLSSEEGKHPARVRKPMHNRNCKHDAKVDANSDIPTLQPVSSASKPRRREAASNPKSKTKAKISRAITSGVDDEDGTSGISVRQAESHHVRTGHTTSETRSSLSKENPISKATTQIRLNRPRSSLKFASQPPRPKLMYKALLADTSSAATATISSSTDGTSQRNIRRLSASFTGSGEAVRTQTLRSIEADEPFMSSLDNNNAAVDVSVNSQISNTSAKSPHNDNNCPRLGLTSIANDQQAREILRSPGIHNSSEVAMIADSPLFMPRTDSQLSPLPATQFTMDDLIVPQRSQIRKSIEQHSPTRDDGFDLPHVTSPQQDDRADTMADELQDLLDADTEELAMIESHSNGQKETMPTANLTRQPPTSEPPVSEVLRAKSRPFRRIVSEILPRTNTNEDALDEECSSDDSVKDFSRSIQMGVQDNLGQKKDDPRPHLQVRQTTSDSALLQAMVVAEATVEPDIDSESVVLERNEAVVNNLSRVPNVLETARRDDVAENVVVAQTETGAWTSTEAFLLFDQWPPGKEKPDYGQQEPADTATTCMNGVRNASRSHLQPNTHAMINKKYGTFRSAKFVSQRS